MKKAITEVKEKTMGMKKDSQLFNVPRTNLRCQMEGKNIDAAFDKENLGSRKPVFSPQQEQLKNHILSMQASHYELTKKDLRPLASQLEENNKLRPL